MAAFSTMIANGGCPLKTEVGRGAVPTAAVHSQTAVNWQELRRLSLTLCWLVATVCTLWGVECATFLA